MINLICRYFGDNVDGVWEHSFGVSVRTTDNPGWLVTVDLKEPLGSESFVYSIGEVPNSSNGNLGQGAWVHCEVRDNRFVGACSSEMLREVDAAFGRFLERR